MARRSEALRGTRIGGYEIVRLIGHGATASVFEATHVALGKAVALKVLHEHLADDAQIRDRFLREGRVAAKLDHPNIVVVLDVGEEAGLPYLVMEFLSGTDLRTLLGDLSLLTVEHALSVVLPIASALAHAHDAGVLHRDLKPANIFLSRDVRDDVVPKLVDFGLSKAAGVESTSSLTASELVAGTILYMAPEQTLGVRNSSPASDQYSLGAILYEALTGEAPFKADGVYALIERIRSELARPPSQINARLPETLDDVVLRALARDPSRRFPSVRAFARALLPFANETTTRPLERDFVERASASLPAGNSPSRPSIKKAVAEAETRHETREAEAPKRVEEAQASSVRPAPPVSGAPGERTGGTNGGKSARADISRARLEAGEIVVPFKHGPGAAPMASSVRSTLITASLLSIREKLWDARYFAALPPALHDQVRDLVAGSWVPIDLGVAHYTALDSIKLSAAEIASVAEDVSHRTQKSFVSVLAKASAEVGVTPWTILKKTPALWERIFVGGDICVYKVGPKEAYVEAVACPLLRTLYFRSAITSYYRAFLTFVAKAAYSTEIPTLVTETSIVFRCSWV